MVAYALFLSCFYHAKTKSKSDFGATIWLSPYAKVVHFQTMTRVDISNVRKSNDIWHFFCFEVVICLYFVPIKTIMECRIIVRMQSRFHIKLYKMFLSLL